MGLKFYFIPAILIGTQFDILNNSKNTSCKSKHYLFWKFCKKWGANKLQ